MEHGARDWNLSTDSWVWSSCRPESSIPRRTQRALSFLPWRCPLTWHVWRNLALLFSVFRLAKVANFLIICIFSKHFFPIQLEDSLRPEQSVFWTRFLSATKFHFSLFANFADEQIGKYQHLCAEKHKKRINQTQKTEICNEVKSERERTNLIQFWDQNFHFGGFTPACQ